MCSNKTINAHKQLFYSSIQPDQHYLLAIDEISTGIMLFKTAILHQTIYQLTNDNAQGEYYLPDVINILLRQQQSVLAFNCDRIPAVHGANTPEQLQQIETFSDTPC